MKLRNKKTGELGTIIDIRVFTDDANYPYETLDAFTGDWEDYAPKEPLNKDEKVKKLLGEVVELELTVNELSKRFDTFNKRYAELCGEEEGCEN